MTFWSRLFGRADTGASTGLGLGATHTPTSADSSARSRGESAIPEELMAVLTRNDILRPGDLLDEAGKKIREGGPTAADALADLIDELLSCRSKNLGWALVAAKTASPTPRLGASIKAVLAAEPVRTGRPGRFSPEIEGDGKIGVTDGEWRYVRESAQQALGHLGIAQEPPKRAVAVDTASLWEQIIRVRDLATRDLLHRDDAEATRRRKEQIALCKTIMTALPGASVEVEGLEPTDAKARAWSMLGTAMYYLLNPSTSTINRPCPEAKFCYEQALKLQPDEGWESNVDSVS